MHTLTLAVLTLEHFIIFAQVDAPMPMSECRDQSTMVAATSVTDIIIIFVLGYAPGDPQAPSPAQPLPLQPAPDPGDVVVDHLQEGMEDQRLVRQDFGAGECWF